MLAEENLHAQVVSFADCTKCLKRNLYHRKVRTDARDKDMTKH
jgi:hypothetical protein